MARHLIARSCGHKEPVTIYNFENRIRRLASLSSLPCSTCVSSTRTAELAAVVRDYEAHSLVDGLPLLVGDAAELVRAYPIRTRFMASLTEGDATIARNMELHNSVAMEYQNIAFEVRAEAMARLAAKDWINREKMHVPTHLAQRKLDRLMGVAR